MNADKLKNLDCSPKEIRKFLFILSGALIFWTLLLWWRTKTIHYFLPGISIFLSSMALINPTLLKPLYRLWMTLTTYLGMAINYLLFFSIYYAVFVPFGFMAKIVGKKFVIAGFREPQTPSYWIKKQYDHLDKKRYEQQF